MKMKLALILGIVAISSHAVSFSWTSDAKIEFNETTLNTSGNLAKAYLVYLGSDNAWSFGDDVKGLLANITDEKVDDSVTRTTGNANTKGKVTQKSYGTMGNAGSTYGVVLTYSDANGKLWYNISSDTYTIPAGTADNAQGLSHSFAFSFDNGGKVSKLSQAQVGTGWYTIPEPSIATLALLGVGMMLKRRRA